MSKLAGRPVGSYSKAYPTRIAGKVTRTYSKYIAMLARCYNPNSHIFKYYGERGIAVCDRWRGKDGFDRFFEDMGEAPEGLTLGRKENDLGYCPDNCEWQTWKQQAQTKRKRQQTPGSLRWKAKQAGLTYMCVYLRINRLGWSEAEALSTPNLGQGGHR